MSGEQEDRPCSPPVPGPSTQSTVNPGTEANEVLSASNPTAELWLDQVLPNSQRTQPVALNPVLRLGDRPSTSASNGGTLWPDFYSFGWQA